MKQIENCQMTAYKQSAPEGIKRTLDITVREVLSHQEGPTKISKIIAGAFAKQHVYNNARTSERFTQEETGEIVYNCYKIVSQYKYLTIEEIEYIFKQGMTGAYGEDVYFSAKAVRSWISTYCSKERPELIKNRYKKIEHLNNAPKEISAEEQKQMRYSTFKRFCEFLESEHQKSYEMILEGEFKASNIGICLTPDYWYNKFIELGLISEPSTEEKNKAVEENRLYAAEIINRRGFDKKSMTNIHGDDVTQHAITLAKWSFVRDKIYYWFMNDQPYKKIIMAFVDEM